MPLKVRSIRERVEHFLCANGLRPDKMDHYLAVLDAEDSIVAGGGLDGDVIKGVAVSEAVRSEGISNGLVSRLLSLASEEGYENVKVFTKPENRGIFESLGFRLIAGAPRAILLENGRVLERYCAGLRGLAKPGRNGVIVMNANPFTLGHRYLMEQALREVDSLYVLPVREDVSLFPYAERVAMIRACTEWGDRVVVPEGSAYSISAATFPTYFLKDLSEAAGTQMRLDLDLFARHIAPALGVSVRFVGTEPADPLTARYNALMKEVLPEHGISVVEIPRLVLPGPDRASLPVSASTVRAALAEGDYRSAAALTPSTTHPYLLASLAGRALRLELDAPLKPGLVCPASSGAHTDMDYALMQKGIAAIRPFFPRMAEARTAEELRQLGLDAERAMMDATGGVNTHRGAIFCLGLALSAARQMEREPGLEDRSLQDRKLFFINHIAQLAASLDDGSSKHRPEGVRGAMQMARDGYRDAVLQWLPYLLSPGKESEVLLRIIASIDDTCVIKRVGRERAEQVKREAQALLQEIPAQAGKDGWTGRLRALCTRFEAEGISPGGAADMLALTIFIQSIFT